LDWGVAGPPGVGASVTEVGVVLGSSVGVGVDVVKMMGVGVTTVCCVSGVGSTLRTNPIAILSTMIRLITNRAI